MHNCEHGYSCHCGGDINDHYTGDDCYGTCECEEDDDYDDDYDDGDFENEREADEWVLACGYSGCCMPGYHFRHECHNGADIEAMYEEHEAASAEGKPATHLVDSTGNAPTFNEAVAMRTRERLDSE